MSLILNDTRWMSTAPGSGRVYDGQGNLSELDRYLAVLQDNKNSCKFVPNDAFVALDMASFVRDQLDGARIKARISTARLALSLAQPCEPAPIQ